MSESDFDIHYVAQLARIELTDAEETAIGNQLNDILGYIDKLEELDVTDVEPMAHPVPLLNVVRADVTRPSLPPEDTFRNAPKAANGLFLVPKIVE